MLPYLDSSKHVSDNILIVELDRAVTEEKQREEKLAAEEAEKKKGTTANVNNIDAASIDNTLLASMMTQMQATQKQLQDNQNQMLAIQNQVSELVKLNSSLIGGGERNNFNKKMCVACTAAKKNFCKHCWKCGQEGHKSADCTNQANL